MEVMEVTVVMEVTKVVMVVTEVLYFDKVTQNKNL